MFLFLFFLFKLLSQFLRSCYNVSLLFSAHTLRDMFVFTWNICFFSFFNEKNEEKELHTFDLISYKALMTEAVTI